MKTFLFNLTRTQVQSATLRIRARSAHEAEELLVDAIEAAGENSDSLLTAIPGATSSNGWTDGETEGSVDHDLEGEE